MLRFAPVAIIIGPAAVLSAALFSQYVGGLNPCPMCIWQRWPHGVAIALALVALLIGPRAAPLYLLIALTMLVGAGLGAFHAGVELGYWEGPSTCAGGDVGGVSTGDLINQIMSAPIVRCDEVVWSFLGVSMAGWNAILSLGLAVVAYLAWRERSA